MVGSMMLTSTMTITLSLRIFVGSLITSHIVAMGIPIHAVDLTNRHSNMAANTDTPRATVIFLLSVVERV